MKRNYLSILLIVSMGLCCIASSSGNPETEHEKKIALHLLYVGHPKTPRAADFVSFLEKHFKQVNIADLDTFTEKTIKDCDVAIIDYSGLVIKGHAIMSPRIPFKSDYSRPIMTVGAAGALVCDRLKLKTGYL